MATLTAVEQHRKECAAYVMPKVAIGDIVYWYPPNQTYPCPMTVLRVGGETIEGHAEVSGNAMKIRKTGLRHCTDPRLEEFEASNHGVWDYSDFAKRLMALEAATAKPVHGYAKASMATRFRSNKEIEAERQGEAQQNTATMSVSEPTA